MVEEARLESVYTPKAYHGFESRSLREMKCFLTFQKVLLLFWRDAGVVDRAALEMR